MSDIKCSPMIEIPKGWGKETFFYHRPQEKTQQQLLVDTVKVLHFEKGKKCSFHYHIEKKEFFAILFGELHIRITDKDENTVFEGSLRAGERLFVPSGYIHQMTAMEDTDLLEVSTLDKAEDSIRLIKGD